MSTSGKITRRLRYMRRGVPFSISQFHELGSSASIQKTLSRLAQEGVVERVAKGLYVRPRSLASMPSIKITASAEQIVKKWAQQYGYTLVRQGVESAYRLGLQRQAPVRTVFWSNGANRTFSVDNEVVAVRHVAESKLRWKSRPEGELLRSFTVTPANSVKLSELKNALSRLKLSEAEVRTAIKKLKAVPLPEGWQVKLEQLEKEMMA
ncbi:DUF6088 family protein [Marinobacter sp. Arc7-DN-1]|uniref:DUF6088 family protein n=1 Tax=Marinobacter sp. Arc7-DN-1 TaxID=2304594 RepID=UPI000E42E735|nr:DUF6088 family protein [Marinobacter sp. Arc7-DN-1]AXS83276.1 hypothetical protein D0851_09620 [Marinobacter sp. Arc7-DN-1]